MHHAATPGKAALFPPPRPGTSFLPTHTVSQLPLAPSLHRRVSCAEFCSSKSEPRGAAEEPREASSETEIDVAEPAGAAAGTLCLHTRNREEPRRNSGKP